MNLPIVKQHGDWLLVSRPDARGEPHVRWQVSQTTEGLRLAQEPGQDDTNPTDWLAVIDTAFQRHPQHGHARLTAQAPPPPLLLDSGVLRPDGQTWTASRQALWQLPTLWSRGPLPAFALQYAMTEGRRHPLRPPKPQGTVYQRHIPWLDQTLSLRAIDPDRDLPAFHRWMNDPVVANFWQEEGELALHRDYLGRIAADPHTTGLIACFDEQPFAYFEVYWAKEDRIAPFYDAQDHDRGWHALVGEAAFRGKPFLTAWMPSISHYLFLDDCRTQRIVIEPRADNDKMIRSLGRCGYARLKEFDFPHKRASLGMLLREHFFADALWIPQP